ncbi:MAG: Lrp/AsnC family transcriptional regulator [Alphaproteobacteria bacterium]|nr:Lrp/AsnC family transcriptional regulator [Alphaproteobacteria bacterium]
MTGSREALARKLIDTYQRDMPMDPAPYAAMGEAMGASEAEIIATLEALAAEGALSRVGAVFTPGALGASTLCAMAVPADRLEAVAAQVSARPEVNHNYERGHRFNLWFVATAESESALKRALAEIEGETGFAVLDLPLLEPFHIDLGFPVQWN